MRLHKKAKDSVTPDERHRAPIHHKEKDGDWYIYL